jgi:hypothetical protein
MHQCLPVVLYCKCQYEILELKDCKCQYEILDACIKIVSVNTKCAPWTMNGVGSEH